MKFQLLIKFQDVMRILWAKLLGKFECDVRTSRLIISSQDLNKSHLGNFYRTLKSSFVQFIWQTEIGEL